MTTLLSRKIKVRSFERRPMDGSINKRLLMFIFLGGLCPTIVKVRCIIILARILVTSPGRRQGTVVPHTQANNAVGGSWMPSNRSFMAKCFLYFVHPHTQHPHLPHYWLHSSSPPSPRRLTTFLSRDIGNFALDEEKALQRPYTAD